MFVYGHPVLLNCSARGGPRNSFTWFYNSTSFNSPLLTIDSLTALNALEYTCVVSNPAGFDTATTTVYLEPRFISVPGDISAMVDDTVVLTCVAQGFPIPDITWQYNGSIVEGEIITSGNGPFELQPEPQISISETLTYDNGVAKASTLELVDIYFNDYGVYTCIVTSMVSGQNFNISSNAILSGMNSNFHWYTDHQLFFSKLLSYANNHLFMHMKYCP